MPVLRLPMSLYKRLELHAEGFDTPANVIEKLLNEYEGVASNETKIDKTIAKPEVIFYPNEEEFKSSLIKNKEALRVIYYADGSIDKKQWVASRFSIDSNLRSNIWSGPLRGWRDQGIIKVEFSVNP